MVVSYSSPYRRAALSLPWCKVIGDVLLWVRGFNPRFLNEPTLTPIEGIAAGDVDRKRCCPCSCEGFCAEVSERCPMQAHTGISQWVRGSNPRRQLIALVRVSTGTTKRSTEETVRAFPCK